MREAETHTPSTATGQPLLRVERLHKRFPVSGRRGSFLHAVDDVSFDLAPGESLGLVGESGCGKSTLVRLLTRLLDPTEGRIVFEGQDLAETPARAFARTPQRAAIQMVFQDPTDSLNPRYTARGTIAEPCQQLAGMDAAAASRPPSSRQGSAMLSRAVKRGFRLSVGSWNTIWMRGRSA